MEDGTYIRRVNSGYGLNQEMLLGDWFTLSSLFEKPQHNQIHKTLTKVITATVGLL